ncbi:MAG: hypothetical protein KC609_12930 [Myxococcales bacterium]|nr:hypothetical protein [Myxococcales bacterium]
MHYLRVLFVTLGLELPLIGTYAYLRHRGRTLWLVALSLGANLLTHGLFYLTFPQLPGAFALKLTIVELVITLVEGLLYWSLGRLKPGEALALSLAANLASLFGGLWLLRPR